MDDEYMYCVKVIEIFLYTLLSLVGGIGINKRHDVTHSVEQRLSQS